MNQNYYIQQDQSSSVGGVTTEDFYDFLLSMAFWKVEFIAKITAD